MDKLYVPYISTKSMFTGCVLTEEEIERGFKTRKLFMKFIGEHNLKKRLYDSLIQKVWCKGQINFSTFIYLPGDAFQMNVQPMLPYIKKGERYGFWIDYDYIQHHIIVVNDWLYGNPVDVQNEIQVVFGEDAAGTQQADNFIGLAMSG